jgi:ubiquinone/menaquinone biosynthesis C-methylase UbiE
MNFYARVLASLKKTGQLAQTDSVLVVAGGASDRDALVAAGIADGTISNVDYHGGARNYEPYPWRRLDGENLDLPDESYDWVVVHAGLHHFAIPARGVCEMLRVARKGIVCIEARDSLLMRLAVRAGITSDYELEPAFLSDGTGGGYRNGPIPNFVYRWTEREFEKTVCSFAPTHRHKFFYDYGFSVPTQRYSMLSNPVRRLAGGLIALLAGIAVTIAPRQGNQFAFGAIKNVSRQPWLTDTLAFDKAYLRHKYDKHRRAGQNSKLAFLCHRLHAISSTAAADTSAVTAAFGGGLNCH